MIKHLVRYGSITVIAILASYLLTTDGVIQIYKTVFPEVASVAGGGLGLNATTLAQGITVWFLNLEICLISLSLILGDEKRYWATIILGGILLLLGTQLGIPQAYPGTIVMFTAICVAFAVGVRYFSENTLGKMTALQPYKKYL
jgi:hypothetical protein